MLAPQRQEASRQRLKLRTKKQGFLFAIATKGFFFLLKPTCALTCAAPSLPLVLLLNKNAKQMLQLFV